jgi:polar amino acid transport system permease protein
MQASYFFDYAGPLLSGALTTVKLTVMSECVALIVGFSVGMALAEGPRILRLPCQLYVELFRGTSALVQLFFLYFILPQAGVRLDPTVVAVAGLGLNSGAYCAEFVRGAIRAVPREQREAAYALGLSHWLALRLVVWPQAVFRALPPLGNMSIDLLKLTSIVSFITINDLTFVAYQINQTTLDTISLFSLVLAFYFVVAQLIAFAFRQAEKRAGRGLVLVRTAI